MGTSSGSVGVYAAWRIRDPGFGVSWGSAATPATSCGCQSHGVDLGRVLSERFVPQMLVVSDFQEV
jgi:hypothetical protein